MRFKIQAKSFLASVQLAATAVPRSGGELPILANLLLRLQNGQLTIIGTSMDLEIVVTTEVADGDNLETTVPAKKLHDLLNRIPGDANIQATLEDDRLTLQAGRGRYRLATIDPTLFPEFKLETGTVTLFLPAAVLRRLLKTVAYAAARDDVRYYLNGVLLEIDGDVLRSVASDGHRLAVSTWHPESPPQGDHRIILPNTAVKALLRLLPDSDADVSLTLSKKALRAAWGDICLSTRLIDGRYPDWRRAVPDEELDGIIVDTRELSDAIARADRLSHPEYHGIRLSVPDGFLHIQTDNPDQDHAEEDVEVAEQATGDWCVDVGFNAKYLSDALAQLGDKTRFRILKCGASHLVAHLSSGEDSFHVVMPMRL